MWDKEKALSLRAHHGLCMAYFVGEGYSSGFKKHMAEVQEKIIAKGLREEICGDCQWSSICAATPSRWAKAHS